MPKFHVERMTDAYVIHTTEVEAETAEEAFEAVRDDDTVVWEANGVREFPGTEFEVFDADFNSKFCTI